MGNIKSCLKKKNSILYKMDQELTKAMDYNSIPERNKTRPYSVVTSLKNWMDLSDQLVDLKTKIHETNAAKGMLRNIFLMAELKSQASKLKNLDCTEGVVSGRYDSSETMKHVEVNVIQKAEMLAVLEVRIEALEDVLDKFNHETLIAGV